MRKLTLEQLVSFDKNKSERLLRWINVGLLVFVAVYTYPVYIFNINSCVDHSWYYALGEFLDFGLFFGVDVFFTYGPLGFLLYASSNELVLYLSIVFWSTVFLHWIFLNYWVAIRSDFRRKYYLIFLGVSFGYFKLPSGIDSEYYFYFVFLFSLLVCLNSGGRILFVVSGLMVSVSFFMKISLFVLMSSSYLLCFFYLAFTCERRLFLFYALTVCCVFLIIPLVCLVIGVSFFDYLLISSELVSGYSDAMQLSHDDDLMRVILALGCGISGLLLLFRKNLRDAFYLLLFVIVVLISFKHSFIRNDSAHNQVFFSNFTILMSYLGVFRNSAVAPSNLRSKFPSALLLLLMAISLPYATGWSIPKFVRNVDFKLTKRINYISSVISKNHYDLIAVDEKYISLFSDSTFSIYSNSISWIESIPSRIRMNFRSFPVLQGYSAYTRRLDSLNREFLMDEAPEYLLLDFETIDGRYPLVDTPLTWHHIIQNYLIHESGSKNQILLKRGIKRDSEQGAFLLNQQKWLEPGQSITIPFYTSGSLRLEIDYNLKGRLFALGYKSGRVRIVVHFDDQSSMSGYIIPDQWKDGVPIYLLSAFLRNRFEALLSNEESLRVVSVSFDFEYPQLVNGVLAEFRYSE